MPEIATDPLLLAAEQAEAEAAAAEAEALAAQASATAARARARAAQLRREAGEHRAAASDAAPQSGAAEDPAAPADPADPGESAPTENIEDTAVAVAAGGTADPRNESAAPSEAAVDLSKKHDSAAGLDSRTENCATEADQVHPGAGTSENTKSGRGAVGRKRTVRRVRAAAGRWAAAGRRVAPTTVRRPGRRAAARTLVAVIVLVSVLVGGYSMWNHYQITAAGAREDEFLQAAREGVVALTTLDSTRAADDVKRVLDHSTGAFRTDFQTRSEDFTKVVEQSAVATQGEITGAAVESMTDDSAVVLVAAVSRVTNAAGAEQEPRVWRLSVTVTREGSELKMSKVEFVP